MDRWRIRCAAQTDTKSHIFVDDPEGHWVLAKDFDAYVQRLKRALGRMDVPEHILLVLREFIDEG